MDKQLNPISKKIYKKNKGLDEKALLDINSLESICAKSDRIKLKLYWDIMKKRNKNEINDFCCYFNGLLIGYLGIFIFSDNEAEVNGMVHPDYRQSGIFSSLLSLAKEECITRNISQFLFICEDSSSQGKAFLDRIGAKLAFSEYSMEFEGRNFYLCNENNIYIRKAVLEDAKVRANINAACFNTDVILMEKRYNDDILDLSKRLFIIQKEETVIGKIDAAIEKDTAFLYQFGILPEYRNKGYGRIALQLILNSLINEGIIKFGLDVVAENEGALWLYRSIGFKETVIYKNYRLSEYDRRMI